MSQRDHVCAIEMQPYAMYARYHVFMCIGNMLKHIGVRVAVR